MSNRSVEIQNPISMSDLLWEVISNPEFIDDFCIYGSGDCEDEGLDGIVYLDEYPDSEDDDMDVYPHFVAQNDLELCYRGDMIHDVIINLKYKDVSIDDKILFSAIVYYDERDDFMPV